jgi:hypothetical protein
MVDVKKWSAKFIALKISKIGLRMSEIWVFKDP